MMTMYVAVQFDITITESEQSNAGQLSDEGEQMSQFAGEMLLLYESAEHFQAKEPYQAEIQITDWPDEFTGRYHDYNFQETFKCTVDDPSVANPGWIPIRGPDEFEEDVRGDTGYFPYQWDGTEEDLLNMLDTLRHQIERH